MAMTTIIKKVKYIIIIIIKIDLWEIKKYFWEKI